MVYNWRWENASVNSTKEWNLMVSKEVSGTETGPCTYECKLRG